MKAEELRLGNCVEYNNEQMTVTGLSYDVGESRIFLNNRFCLIESLVNPIPLTESLLLKCGYYQEYFDDFNHSDQGAPCIQKFKGEYFDTYEDQPSSMPIKFLHQLQNLHFISTGEELCLRK